MLKDMLMCVISGHAMIFYSRAIKYVLFCFLQKKAMRTSTSSPPLHVHVNDSTPVHVHVKKGMKNIPIKPVQVRSLLVCRYNSNVSQHQYLVLSHIETVSTSQFLLLQVKAKGSLRPTAKVKTRVPWIPPGKASTREALYKWEVRKKFIMYALLKEQLIIINTPANTVNQPVSVWCLNIFSGRET